MTDSNLAPKKNKFSVLLAASLAINASLIGLVGGHYLAGQDKFKLRKDEDKGMHQPPVEHVMGLLNADERKVLRTTMMQYWKNSQDERQIIHEKHENVMSAIKLDPFDREKVEAALNEFENINIKIKKIAASGVLDTMETLSPDARVALAETLLLRNRRVIHKNSGEGRRPPMEGHRPRMGDRGMGERGGDRPHPSGGMPFEPPFDENIEENDELSTKEE